MSLRLVNLDCPSCGSAMRGEGLDTIFFCSHCGGAAVLESHGLKPVDGTGLLPVSGRRAEVWRPAWRAEVDVRIHERVRFGGIETPGWEGRRVFYIPAFNLPLDDLTRLSRALAEVSETAAEVPREPIHGGTLAFEDALVLIRHILTGDEIRRSDMVTSVIVDVVEVSRSLVALPFGIGEGRLECAVTGTTVRVSND
jgi:hypothetical protein